MLAAGLLAHALRGVRQRGLGRSVLAAGAAALRLLQPSDRGASQAALDSLPATFEWCRSRGLTGPQTAKLLDHVANKSYKSVVQFAALVQPVWQLMDSYVAAWAEQQHQAGDSKQRKHTSLAEALRDSTVAAAALGMPPGHVEAWLAAVSQQLPAAAIGGLLLGMPNVVCGGLDTAPAAISWAVNVLGVADPAAFFAAARGLLKLEVPTLQRNLDSLPQALGWPAEQARHLVLKWPRLLGSSPDTVQAALAWLRQLFPDAEQLANVIDRGALLLTSNLNSKDTQHKLRLLSEVVGVSTEECLTSGIGYLTGKLESTAVRYVLAQERAPYLLFSRSGEPSLSWIKSANEPHNLARLGMSRDEFNAFVRGWAASLKGQRLLEGLRAGSVEGWPRLPSHAEAQQRLQAATAKQRASKAAAAAGKQRGRGRPRKAAA
ncbi:guanine deaminase [Chlorella sorokiniana]|uniref:Guanine deaminase n=1 Tax=Chlorella sorokiniana TaxID=3076 RepID=A0A2P6TPA8_CHLSO|nr:guanine deaminase [Chlorella sorokiniana]|eukprot:PRW51139.1 guanine deaminase [Chlorella sorokiniana]